MYTWIKWINELKWKRKNNIKKKRNKQIKRKKIGKVSKYTLGHSIITLSQNDQNLNLPPPLFALVWFW